MATFTKNGIHNPHIPSLKSSFFQQHGYTEAPVVIQCYITLRCGLSCTHCLATRTEMVANDMSLEIFDKLCREAASLGVQEMLITGGEPLYRKNFKEIVDCLSRHGLIWSLNTAACPNEQQQAAILSYPPAYVAVSIDGPMDVHNVFRGSANAFADATSSIRFFSKITGTTVCAGTTISSFNLPYFDETFRVVMESGAHRWGIHLLIPEGRAKLRKDLFPTAFQMRKLLKSIALKRLEFPVSLCDEMGYAGEWERLVRDESFFCAAGRAMCAVLPDGSIMPCSTLDPKHCEGNLTQNTLAEIWRTGFTAQRNPHRGKKCANCKDWLVCGSGCWLQRQHGTQCFKHLWKVPKSFKATACIGLCIGTLSGCNETQIAQPDYKLSDTMPDPSPLILPSDLSKTQVAQTNDKPPQKSDSKQNETPLILAPPGIYAGKASSGRRHLKVNPRTELSILKSLRWLNAHQNEDGSWSEKQPEAVTGLVLLCFIAHNETPSSPEFGATLVKSMKFLLSKQAPDGQFPGDYYSHSICTFAISEAYRLTRIPMLEESMEKGIEHIIKTQEASGGWSIGYKADAEWNLLFSAWQIQALKAGQLAGSNNPKLQETLQNAATFVQKTAFIDGAFYNSPAAVKLKLVSGDAQGAGARCLQWLGLKDSEEAKSTVQWIVENINSDRSQDLIVSEKESGLPCSLYFQSQATFNANHKNLDQKYVLKLLRRERTEGCWQADEKNPVRYDIDTYYLTTMNCLTLQIRSQYLSVFKE